MKRMLILGLMGVACGGPQQQAGEPPPIEEAGETPPMEEPPAENPADDTERWTIAPERVDCQGVGPMRCMRVQRGEGAEWTLFYDAIVGLEAEEGVEYTIDVRITEVANPPADGSSQRVELVRVVAQRTVQAAAGCLSNDDCEDGQMCFGPEGCDQAWNCVPMRPCTRDLVTYCSCEGTTVRGSGSCPPAPYRSRNACP